MAKSNDLPVVKIALLQASGLTLYCTLVGTVLLFGNEWFGPMNNFPLLGPMLFLTLFALSALICGLITLGFPAKIYLEEGDVKTPLKIVSYQALWMVVIVLAIILSLYLIK